MHVVYVLTSSLAARRIFGGHGRLWRAANLRVTVISSPGSDLRRFGDEEGVETVGLPIERELSPLRDIVSLYRLWREFRRLRPQLVECGTPKAGLLGGMAARLAGVPVSIYTLHGLRLETLRGWRRSLLHFAEKLTVKLADETIAVSPSLLLRARSLGLIGSGGIVAGPGSATGIDAARFADVACRAPQSQTIGFVGRLTRDKGIAELIEAFDTVKQQQTNARLLLVGDFEDGDALPLEIQRRILSDPAILLTGFVDDAAPFYADIDVVALPSYREGFPLVALEAAAAARPIVAADCTGMRDAVVNGETGLIIPMADSQALAEGLLQFLKSPEIAAQMGQMGRDRVLRQFQRDHVWADRLELYERLCEGNPVGRPIVQEGLKRAFDAVAALILLALFSPLILLVALALFVTRGGPVFFNQVRPGLRQRPLVVHKFRTMSDERSAGGDLLPDAQRLTKFGRFLRRWSLDELPQLWSVLRGDMSLVGPRPLLSEYVERYSRRQARRFHAPPGLTGWAQVNGRNEADWEERLELDVWYVENWSLRLDLRILAKTLWIVLAGRGVEATGSATPPPFLGVVHRRP